MGQIKSFGLTNTLVVVVRYYGGVKLGVGGLIAAYRKSAQLTLEGAKTENRVLLQHFELTFTYAHLNKVMRIIREKQFQVISQQMDMDCSIRIGVRKSQSNAVTGSFAGVKEVSISER